MTGRHVASPSGFLLPEYGPPIPPEMQRRREKEGEWIEEWCMNSHFREWCIRQVGKRKPSDDA